MKLLRNGDRIGLYMLVATLAVIGTIIAMLYHYQARSLEERTRAEAVSLARILTRTTYEDLVRQRGLLEIVRESWQDRGFAYAVIVEPGGHVGSEVAAPGVVVPKSAFPVRPETWLTDRELTLETGATIIDVQAPLIRNGEVASYLRLGFARPTFSIRSGQLPFFATLAFAIFLLTPIFLWLVRREVRPLKHASDELTTLVRGGQFSELKLSTTGEFGEFMGNFNAFIQLANERMQELEGQHADMQTRAQLLTYRKSRAETVLDSIPEAIIIIDQTGTISFANRRVETLLGVNREQVLEENPNAWCQDSQLLDVLSRYTSRHASRQYLAQTVRIESQREPAKNLSIKAYPLFTPSNPADVQGTLIIIRDISKEILSQRSQSEFVTHVAHELKTPLHTVGLAAERLLYDDALDAAGKIEAANVVQDEVDRMAGLINDLLSITKIEMGELPVERGHLKLQEFLKDAFDTVTRSSGDKDLTFEIHLPTEFSTVFLDKDLLRIAVNNLLTNAIKYTDPGGTVALRGEENDDAILISVSDTGIGIEDSDQKMIFTKFFRADSDAVRDRSGHGLGLSLTQEIVQMHGGTLSVESEPGRGSTFTIELKKEASLLKRAV